MKPECQPLKMADMFDSWSSGVEVEPTARLCSTIPRTRKMAMEYGQVGKGTSKKPTADDVPWGGGYVPPILSNHP
ncbi:hypothetical protein SDJN03_24379, partial [Cucurbita argyrosperma subsp. sororia]